MEVRARAFKRDPQIGLTTEIAGAIVFGLAITIEMAQINLALAVLGSFTSKIFISALLMSGKTRLYVLWMSSGMLVAGAISYLLI